MCVLFVCARAPVSEGSCAVDCAKRFKEIRQKPFDMTEQTFFRNEYCCPKYSHGISKVNPYLLYVENYSYNRRYLKLFVFCLPLLLIQ